MNWYIGQDIVCIKSAGYYKKDQIYTIKGLQSGFCKCGGVNLDLGFKSASGLMTCDICWHSEGTSILWCYENDFAPLDQDISELTEILTNPHKQGLTIK